MHGRVRSIVKAYTNRKGDIRDHIVGVKLENLTGNKSLSDAQVRGIVEMLDQVSRRDVFKELNDEMMLTSCFPFHNLDELNQ